MERVNIYISVCTLFIALYGLFIWRKQLKGTARFELARDILESIYRVKIGFSEVRNPFITSGEYPEKFRNKNLLTQSEESECIQYVYTKRFEFLNKEFVELEFKFIKGLVLFGDKYKDAIIPLRKCNATLKIGVRELIESKIEKDYYINHESCVDYQKIIYEHPKETEYDILSSYIELASNYLIAIIKPNLTDKIIDQIRTLFILKRIQKFDIPLPMRNITKNELQ